MYNVFVYVIILYIFKEWNRIGESIVKISISILQIQMLHVFIYMLINRN